MENRVSIVDFAENKSLRELLAYVEGSVAFDKCQCPRHLVGRSRCPLDVFVPGESLVERYTEELEGADSLDFFSLVYYLVEVGCIKLSGSIHLPCCKENRFGFIPIEHKVSSF